MSDIITSILNLSPQGLFVFAFYCFGLGLKKSPIADWQIPWIIGISGGVVGLFMLPRADAPTNIPVPEVYLFIQGGILAATAVYGHQLLKQFLNRDRTNDGGTQFITKSETVQQQQQETTKPTENK